MKLLIDDANIEKIKEIYDKYAIDGVTTNPSILAKNGKKPYETLKEIRKFIGPDAELHVQVISTKAEGMIAEAERMVKELGLNTYVKIPTVPEGLKAMKILSARGYHVTATTIYTPMQTYLAAKAGADYAAPYVNRIDNLGDDGIDCTRQMQKILDSNNFKTKILAASFTNSHQVQSLCYSGVGACTVPAEGIERFIKNASVLTAVDAFVEDFEALCGKGKTMLDCD